MFVWVCECLRETAVGKDGIDLTKPVREDPYQMEILQKLIFSNPAWGNMICWAREDETVSNDSLEPFQLVLVESLQTEIILNISTKGLVETGFSKYLFPCLLKLRNSSSCLPEVCSDLKHFIYEELCVQNVITLIFIFIYFPLSSKLFIHLLAT